MLPSFLPFFISASRLRGWTWSFMLIVAGLKAWGQPTTPPSNTKNIPSPNTIAQTTDPVAPKVQRYLGFFAVADQPGTTWDDVTLEGVNWGVGLQWRIKEIGSLLGGGMDLAYQPLGRFVQDVQVLQEDGNKVPGTLKLQNQNVSFHYVLRLAPFKGMIQPFAEGLVGGRGALLTTNLEVEGGQRFEHFDDASWGVTYQFGWGGGVRFKLGEKARLTLRYADLRGGELVQVDETTLAIGSDGSLAFETKETELPTRSLQVGFGWDF